VYYHFKCFLKQSKEVFILSLSLNIFTGLYLFMELKVDLLLQEFIYASFYGTCLVIFLQLLNFLVLALFKKFQNVKNK
jgi:hypothetical protein